MALDTAPVNLEPKKTGIYNVPLEKGTNKNKAKLAVSADVSEVFPFHPLYFTPQQYQQSLFFLKTSFPERRAITHSSPGKGGLRMPTKSE